jgi:hypothetical protein
LYSQYEAGKIASSKELLSLLTELCAPETLEVGHCASDLDALATDLDINFISEQLILLIHDMDMPDASLAEAKKITHALKEAQTEEDFRDSIDAALVFLQKIKKYEQQEREEMEVFLAHVTQKFNKLSNSLLKFPKNSSSHHA